MKHIYKPCIILLFAALAVSCTNQNSTLKETDRLVAVFDLNAAQKIIREKSDKFTQSHITRDTAYLNSIFALDAKVFPPNAEVVIGRAAIAAVNNEWVNYDIKEFSEESTAFYGNEEFLVDEGNYYLRFGEEDIIDIGHYIYIWKQENGEWKMFTNMWTSSLPVTPTE